MELTKKLTPQWVDIEHEGETLGFLCAPLTAEQSLNVRMEYDVASGEMTGTGLMMAVRYAVRDWRGITENGEPVRCSPAALDRLFSRGDASMSLLLQKLGAEIVKRTWLTEAEQKN
mgnify:FL=1